MKCIICGHEYFRKHKYQTCSERCRKKYCYDNNIGKRRINNKSSNMYFYISRNLKLGQILCSCIYCSNLYTSSTSKTSSCPDCRKIHRKIIVNNIDRKLIDKNTRDNWRKNNRKKYNKTCSKYQRTPKIRKYKQKKQIEYYYNNINYRVGFLLRKRLYQAFNKKNIPKQCSSKEYGIDFIPIIEKLKNELPSDYENGKYHIDHIIPISSFDFTKNEEIQKAFSPENHQWLLAEENLKKGSKILYESN